MGQVSLLHHTSRWYRSGGLGMAVITITAQHTHPWEFLSSELSLSNSYLPPCVCAQLSDSSTWQLPSEMLMCISNHLLWRGEPGDSVETSSHLCQGAGGLSKTPKGTLDLPWSLRSYSMDVKGRYGPRIHTAGLELPFQPALLGQNN